MKSTLKVLLACISASLAACNAPSTQSATSTSSLASTASTKGCPTYDLAGTWTETLNPGSHASTGTFDKTSCSLSVTYCNTTMTLAGAANPAFTAWAAVEVTVQADGSVPPACLQPGQYSCTAVTAYNGSGIRQLAINCGVTHTWLKQ